MSKARFKQRPFHDIRIEGIRPNLRESEALCSFDRCMVENE